MIICISASLHQGAHSSKLPCFLLLNFVIAFSSQINIWKTSRDQELVYHSGTFYKMKMRTPIIVHCAKVHRRLGAPDSYNRLLVATLHSSQLMLQLLKILISVPLLWEYRFSRLVQKYQLYKDSFAIKSLKNQTFIAGV